MKLRVIEGLKNQIKQKTGNKQTQPENRTKLMEDYYPKERPRPQDMEKAEGDEDIVDAALKRQEKMRKTGNAA